MTCREFADFLSEYFAGEIAGSERATFETHLGECRECSAYLEGYAQAVRLGKAAYRATADDPLPDDVPEDLVRAILAARPRLQ